MAKNSIYDDNGMMFGSKSKNNKNTKKPQTAIIMNRNKKTKQRTENHSNILEVSAILFTIMALISFAITLLSYTDMLRGPVGDAAEHGIGLSLPFVLGFLATISTTPVAVVLGFIAIARRALRKK